MTYDEFLRQVAKAGLKANEFARLMDMSPKSLSNYKKTGRIPHHLAVIAVLLAEMKERSIDFRDILARIGASTHQPDKAEGE